MKCAFHSGRKRVILFALPLISFIAIWAGDTVKYSKVQIQFRDKEQVRALARNGLIFDHVFRQKDPAGGFTYNAVLSASEMQ